jgi:hypothetical protein
MRYKIVNGIAQLEQPQKRTVTGLRGRPASHAIKARQTDGTGFQISWDATIQMGSVKFREERFYLVAAMRYEDYQAITNSADPVRLFNSMFPNRPPQRP